MRLVDEIYGLKVGDKVTVKMDSKGMTGCAGLWWSDRTAGSVEGTIEGLYDYFVSVRLGKDRGNLLISPRYCHVALSKKNKK